MASADGGLGTATLTATPIALGRPSARFSVTTQAGAISGAVLLPSP
jgi:hypothetical protein